MEAHRAGTSFSFFLCVVLSAFMAIAIGCSDRRSSTPSPKPDGAGVKDGNAIVQDLQRRFGETFSDCGNDTRPVVLCSGILMRATEYSPDYRSWLPNPATASSGVSFSWLRWDSNFPDTHPTGNGFIVYPWFDADGGDDPDYAQLNIRCIYPQDAWTAGPDRCVNHERPGSGSTRTPLCQSQGVFTAQDWIRAGFTNNENQCAFDVSVGRPSTAVAWMQSGEVRRIRYAFERNEVVVEAWSQYVGARMPVEAFFYRDNCHHEDHQCNPFTTIGQRRTDAGLDQRDFFQRTGRWVPVVRWTPASSAGLAPLFTYSVSDQNVRP